MEVCTHTISVHQQNRYDPTRTTVLRNLFAKQMKRRFTELSVVIKKAIVDQNCFGAPITALQMDIPGQEAFAFRRSAEKVEAFMEWLQRQINAGILQISQFEQIGVGAEHAWTNYYILDSYKRGVMRARAELQRAGYNVPSIEDTGGIDMVMGTPFHIDRVGLLFTRVFSDLKGITEAMASQIARVLAQGMVDGDGPALLARKLLSVINGTNAAELGITDTLGRFIPASRRAMMLARTELIRAHHLATIQEYRNWALEGVYVRGEWKTAGDDRVCSDCASLEGKVYSLDEIEGMIPRHPMCRCIALPWIKELQKYR